MPKLEIKNRYGIIPDELLNNPKVSLKAKGMFGYLQSKPDGWKFSVERISHQSKDGIDGVKSAISELEKFGHLIRKPNKNSKGQWAGYDYVLVEKPLAENPLTEKPLADNTPTLSNKDNSKIDNSNKEVIIENEAFSDKNRKDLIDLFKAVNPNYKILFSRKNQANALERLVKQFGLQEIENIIRFLPKIINEKYAPTITTPIELENKFGKLLVYINRQKQSQVKIII